MDLRILVLKSDKLSTFLRPGYNLFHSMIVDGKREFFKKLWFFLKRRIFSAFLVEYNLRLTRIKLKSIENVQSFLFQNRF